MSSYYTKYFELDEISSLKSKVNSCISSLNNASQKTSNLITYINGNEWISDAKTVLLDALEENKDRIENVISCMNKYLSVLDSASEIKTLQDKMNSIGEYDVLVSKSSNIDSLIDSFISKVESI
jgi:predicted type IV restriction endonuclease